jgi:hypothetical protein
MARPFNVELMEVAPSPGGSLAAATPAAPAQHHQWPWSRRLPSSRLSEVKGLRTHAALTLACIGGALNKALSWLSLTYSARAVVFGDIATSPLYTLDSIFQDLRGNASSRRSLHYARLCVPRSRQEANRPKGSSKEQISRVYHLLLRFGFAEQPANSKHIAGILLQQAQRHPVLAELSHLSCSLGHCVATPTPASRAEHGAACAAALPADVASPSAPLHGCGPVTFYVAHDRLERGSWTELLPAVLFNILVSNCSGRTVFLHLPSPLVVELQGHVDLQKLRRSTGKEI